jgi:hypothetical protein
MKRLLVFLLLTCFCSGCFTMKYAAPPKSQVVMISQGKQATFKKSVKVWYALWGAAPISENSSARIIAENDLKQVRVTTKITFVDYLIGAFTGFVSIVPATMTVEGNQ